MQMSWASINQEGSTIGESWRGEGKEGAAPRYAPLACWLRFGGGIWLAAQPRHRPCAPLPITQHRCQTSLHAARACTQPRAFEPTTASSQPCRPSRPPRSRSRAPSRQDSRWLLGAREGRLAPGSCHPRAAPQALPGVWVDSHRYLGSWVAPVRCAARGAGRPPRAPSPAVAGHGRLAAIRRRSMLARGWTPRFCLFSFCHPQDRQPNCRYLSALFFECRLQTRHERPPRF